MKNFFNAIGVADMERVHSAMIAWILDDENDLTLSSNNGQTISKFSTFPQKDRSELLCSLFNVTPTKKFKSIKTCVEWNDIDILIETEDTKGCKEVWIIENKLKSQENKSKVDADEQKRWGIKVNEIWQTEKYTHIIKDNYSSIPQHYVLLSLGGDTARYQTVKWEVCKYEKIYIFLNGLLQGNSSYLLVQEYNNSIGRIITELNNFLKSPVNCGRVFDKKMTKADKARFLSNPNNLLCIERYILENGLETIFQKCFLGELWKKYRTNYSFLSSYNWEITDSKGTAMLDIFFPDILDNKTGKKYHSQIELQNGSFKIQIHHVDKNKKHESTKTVFLAKWQPVFEKVRDDNNTIARNKIWETNLPDTRPFISLSKSRKAKNADNWWKKNDIIIWLYDNFCECSKMLEALIKVYEQLNGTTCSRV